MTHSFLEAKLSECGSLLPLLKMAPFARYSRVLLKAAASCRTPKASCGRKNYESLAETEVFPDVVSLRYLTVG